MYEPLYKQQFSGSVKVVKDVRYGPADRNFLDVRMKCDSPDYTLLTLIDNRSLFLFREQQESLFSSSYMVVDFSVETRRGVTKCVYNVRLLGCCRTQESTIFSFRFTPTLVCAIANVPYTYVLTHSTPVYPGNYFAEKGIVVVVGNHQLVPNAK